MTDQNPTVVEPTGTDPVVTAEPIGTDPTAQVTEPNAGTVDPAGTDQIQPTETPEQIAEKRAHYQTLLQTRTEELKTLQAEMDELTAQAPPAPLTQPIQSAQPAQPAPSATPQAPLPVEPVPEIDDSEPITLSQLNNALDRRDLRQAETTAKQTRETRQAETQAAWEQEQNQVEATLTAIQKKYGLGDEIVDEAAQRAIIELNLPQQLGLAKMRLTRVKQILSDHIMKSRSTNPVAQQVATDQQKLDTAGQLQQPATGATDPQVQNKVNEAAKQIAEFDTRYDII